MSLSRSSSQLAAQLHRDRRNEALVPMLATYGLVALAIAGLGWQLTWWTALCAVVVIGLMQYRMVLACHEAVHKAFLYPLWLNELSGIVNGALVGMNFHRYRLQHLAHHRAPSIAEDPDAYIYRPILQARPGLPRINAYLLGMIGEIFEKFRQKGFGGDKDPQARWHSLAMVGLNGALFLLFWWLVGWWGYLAFWLFPVLSVALLVNRTRVFVEHAYVYAGRTWDEADIKSQPVRTIDLVSFPLERFFLSGFCFNYHAAHHQLPTIPHYNLQQLSEHLESHEAEYGQIVRRTYFGTLWHMLRRA